MNEPAERWTRKKEIFGQAMELPAGERAAYLGTACGEDRELRREIEELLAAGDEAADFLEGPAASSLGLDGDPLIGTRVGRWELIEQLGRGGMGTVYRGRRADREFEHQVAIKVVRSSLDREEIDLRFRTERSILASLAHPNVARLYDGGTTGDGRPYFVMELVDGLPITRHCDERRLDVPERLSLFRQVCSAVQAAHGNLIVHRDLKPSNILVTGDGVPKLLDFGIAKLLDPGAGESARTRTHLRPMTPEYASPEQIQGAPITTASDVYSLGVLLYELLTGRRPHEGSPRTPQELERAICEREPEKPSTVVTGGDRPDSSEPTTSARLASRRATSRELARRLAGDLDNIVLMALRREPERRYASVQQLSEDIRRHLENLPVLARGESATYRASRFVRRHRAGVAAAVLVLVSLVGGIVLTTLQARIAERERRRAERVNQVMRRILASPDASWYAGGLGPDAKIVDVLRAASRDLSGELVDVPEVEADVRATLGKSFRFLGLYEEAAYEAERALEIQRAAGEESFETADLLHTLGAVRFFQADFAAAESHLNRGLELCARIEGCPARLEAPILNMLGATLVRQRRLPEAEAVLERGVAAARRSDELSPAAVATISSSLGYALMDQGKLDAAQAHYEEAQRLLERETPEAWVERFPVTVNLASIAWFKADFETAARWYDQGVEQAAAGYGEEHVNYALALLYRSSNSLERGDLEAARSDSDRAMARLETFFPPHHPELVRAQVNRSEVLCFTGEAEAGIVGLEDAVDRLRTLLPAGDWRIGNAETRLGRCLARSGRAAEGRSLIERGVAQLEQALAPGDPRPAQARSWLQALEPVR